MPNHHGDSCHCSSPSERRGRGRHGVGTVDGREWLWTRRGCLPWSLRRTGLRGTDGTASIGSWVDLAKFVPPVLRVYLLACPAADRAAKSCGTVPSPSLHSGVT